MPITLVQSRMGGSVSGTVVGASQILTTSAAGFLTSTAVGNLLVLAVFSNIRGAGCSPPIEPGFPTIAGNTWIVADGAIWFNPSPRAQGFIHTYYLFNAPTLNPSDTMTTSVSSNTSTGSNLLTSEFHLYEFSGIDNSSDPEDDEVVRINQTGGTPNAANINTISPESLVLVAFSGDSNGGTNLSAGVGYTLGIDAIVSTIGQLQYQLNVPLGTIATAFGGGTSPKWGCQAVAFRAIAVIPILQVAPLTLSFMAAEGGTSPDDQNVAVANGNGGTLNWTVVSDQAWLTGLPLSGTDAGVVTTSVDITGLVAGVYTGHLTFTAAGATSSPQIVTITLTVSAPTTDLSVTPLSLSFEGTIGEGNPPDQFATVSNVGTPGAMNFTTASSASWLTVVPSFADAGTVPIQLTISVDITTLTEGSYNGTITVTAVGAIDSPQHIAIVLTVATPTPPPPVPIIVSSTALTQVDTWELDNGMTEWGTDTGTPYAWHETTLPQQQIAIAPTPDDVGQIGLLYVALANVLDGTGVALTVPDDWTPYILWGTLGELLSSDGPSYDPVRAKYCQQRFDEGVELARLVLGG